ncbi:phosphoribosyltransferase [Candidatus Giovannonibacteria bacterium]|nr:phosphoribosyltransferase [Candidatus Giovannonibacteria bacterium]
MPKKLYYSWVEFEKDIPKLVSLINKLHKNFDGIYGIPRGGLVLAVRLSHELNLPMIMGGVTKNTLVVDDVSDTGSMLAPLKEREAVIVTIFYKPWSKVEPVVWLRKTEKWIVFPWEKK